MMGILDLFRSSPEERLAKRYMAALRACGVQGAMRHSKEEDAVLADQSGGTPVKLYLHNLRMELARSPEQDHEKVLHRFALGMLEGQADAPGTYEEVRPRLMAVLKDDGYTTYIDTMHQGDGSTNVMTPLNAPLVPGLVLMAVEDLPNSFRYVMRNDAERWGVAAEQVLADARANAQSLQTSFAFREGGTYLLSEGDAYAATRLLVPQPFRELGLKGSPVVIVPDRHTLVVAGSEDETGLAELGKASETCIQNGQRLLSAIPLVLGDQGWQEFTPPAAVAQAFGNARRLMAANFWADFKEALDSALQARSEDIFVAKCSVLENRQTGAYETMAVLSKDVDTIFPAVDCLMFFEVEGKPVRRAQWSAVRRAMDAQMGSLEGLPERCRVRAYPTAEQMVGMGAELQAH
jgi:hypothetical protein